MRAASRSARGVFSGALASSRSALSTGAVEPLISIPLVDPGGCLDADAPATRASADRLLRALASSGFAYIGGHAVDPAVRAAAFDAGNGNANPKFGWMPVSEERGPSCPLLRYLD